MGNLPHEEVIRIMKNERIITHFQSYRTAHDCVKDLTPYFAGRISIMTSNPMQSAEETPNVSRENQEYEIRDRAAEASMVENLSEIGGIALGTVAYLVPGLGPVLSGGPIVGKAVGDTVGYYLSSEMSEVRDERARRANRSQPARKKAADGECATGSFFLAVDTFTEEEADFVTNVMEQHGGKVSKMLLDPSGDDSPAEEEIRYVPPDAETRYIASANRSGEVCLQSADHQALEIARSPESLPEDDTDDRLRVQESASEVEADRATPAASGYDLDPITPLSPQGWIDPNIGLGSYDLRVPILQEQDDMAPPENRT